MQRYLWLAFGVSLSCEVAAEGPAAEIWANRKEVPLQQSLAETFHLKPTGTEVPSDGVVAFPKLDKNTLGRWSVWLKVPETGDYKFFVAADDSMSMWLSSDETLAQAKVIAFNKTATDPSQWIRYPSQQSAPVHLEKGKKHALLLGWCNNGGVGHAALGWQTPGASAPVAVPLVDSDGSSLFEPYQAPPSDRDNDLLPDEWEKSHGLAVNSDKVDMSGWGDRDGDTVNNHEEYLEGSDPNKVESRPGLVTFDWSNQVPQVLKIPNRTMPSEIFWLQTSNSFESRTQTLDKLSGNPSDKCVVRLRALIKPPVDGYYNFCPTATGTHAIFVSEDSTPHGINFRGGQLHYTFGTFDGPPIYFKKDEIRYFELRQINSGGPRALVLSWRLPDGTTQTIPANCIQNYIPTDKDPDPAVRITDGEHTALLKAITLGKPIELNLRQGSPLTNGWAAFTAHDPKDILVADPAPDSKMGGISAACGGTVEFEFKTTTAGYAVLATQIQLCVGMVENGHLWCEREIDGVRFGGEELWALDGSAPLFRCVTPWLAAGRHKLRLHFTPQSYLTAARIYSVAVHPITDEADTATVRAFFTKENAFFPARGDGGFLRSPACVEFQSTSSGVPDLKANNSKMVVKPGSTNAFWADVPLPDDGKPVKLTVSSPTYRVENTAVAHWAETHVGEHRMLCLRQGDALRITARPRGVAEDITAQAVIVFRDKELETPHGKPVVCRFNKVGDEKVIARYTPEGGTMQVTEMTIRVLSRWSEELKAGVVQMDMTSNLNGPSFVPGAWVDGGETINIQPKPSGDGHKATDWRCTVRRAGPQAAVVRAGRNGPILGRIQVDGVEIWSLREIFTQKFSGNIVTNYGQETWLVTGLPAGWRISTKFTDTPNWELYRIDPKKPPEKVIYPWRYGAISWGQFWLKAKTQERNRPSVAIEFLPPEKPARN